MLRVIVNLRAPICTSCAKGEIGLDSDKSALNLQNSFRIGIFNACSICQNFSFLNLPVIHLSFGQKKSLTESKAPQILDLWIYLVAVESAGAADP